MNEGNSVFQVAAASHRGLLAVIVILGVLILVALGALVGGLLLGAGPGAGGDEAYSMAIPVPADSSIAGAELDGPRLMLRIDGGANADSVVVLEAATGRIVGRIELDPQP
jgi:hypothetical protein